jgi:hypothetical protein
MKLAGGWEEYLRVHTGIHGRVWLSHSAYLLIDEAQEGHWDLQLWNGFFKSIEGESGPWVITFSSYGSPSGGYQGLDESKGRYVKTPLMVQPEQRISLEAEAVSATMALEPVGLLFNEQESSDVITSLVHSYGEGMFPADLQKELYHITAGHAGALTSLLRAILNIYHVRIQNPSVGNRLRLLFIYLIIPDRRPSRPMRDIRNPNPVLVD